MTTYTNAREIPASPKRVFAAISEPERLARWWGPAGFSNTFQVCEFKPGGRWLLTMHGPDGHKYPNEAVFLEIEDPVRLVVHHVSAPRYRLTVTLESMARGTRVIWSQAFEDARVGERLEQIVVPANEHILARLEVEVARA